MTQLDPVSAPRRWLGLLVAILAVIGLLVVVLSLVMSAGAAKVAMLQAAPASPAPPTTASANTVRPRPTTATQPATQPATVPVLPAIPVPPPPVIRPDAEQPEWKHTSVTLNDPAGEYVVPPLDNHRIDRAIVYLHFAFPLRDAASASTTRVSAAVRAQLNCFACMSPAAVRAAR